MKEIKLKPLYWVALSCILLVLVVSYLAYGVYVPKKQEIDNLQTQMTMAKIEQARLRKIPVPKKVTAEDKTKLATLVPTDFDQSRFLKNVRVAEHDTAVKLTDITFQEQGGDRTAGKTTPPGSAPQGNAPGTTPAPAQQVAPVKGNDPKKTALTEQKGHLTVTGDYKQVRQFIDKFSQIGRLIFFDHWDLKAIEPPKPLPLPLPGNVPPVAQPQNARVNTNGKPAANTITAPPSSLKNASVLTPNTPVIAPFSPTAILGNPVQTLASTASGKTQVTLDFDFTIYYAPSAKGLLPPPNAIKTYEPTERTNPVEMR